MTARQLFISIEDDLHDVQALCDMVAVAASSNELTLDSDSVVRVVGMALSTLNKVIDYCESQTKEKKEEEVGG